MLSTVAQGQKGHLIASGKEFIIVRSGSGTTSIIRYRNETTEYEIQDAVLREASEDGWKA
jgi:hypothetical protein